MIDLELLQQKIRESGLKMSYISEKMGISRYTLHMKLVNEREFKVSEMQSICDILGISEEEKSAIFFAGCADKSAT